MTPFDPCWPSGGASGPAVPASQQEVPEPKKYTGGNIPSRSFRVLQQMTADDQGMSHQMLPDVLPDLVLAASE